jgi:serine protease AprX
VEILWLKGVVVVASVGNKGPAGGHNTAKTAPANDPFIIVVGASNEHDSGQLSDDTIAPFSSHGITVDGFSRPDIIAPGYDIYSALSPDSTWDDDYPHRLGFQGEYFRLSGTSMAAPMTTGAVALLLQDEPNLTPDQVKYRLMHSGEVLYDEEDGVAYPYLDVYAAVHGTTTESAYAGFMPHMLLARMALIAYWASQDGDAQVDWENVDWEAVNWDSVNWNSVNWNSVNWNSVNWNSVNWNSVNWNSVNWNSVNWNSVNWNSVNWNSVNWNSVNWNEVQMDGVFWGPDKAPKPKKDKNKDK